MTRIETVLVIDKSSKVLLGLKNSEKKFGGKWNGFGGGLEDGESLEECTIRETFQETGMRVRDLNKIAEVLFKFEDNEQAHYVYFFKSENYEGEPKVSEDFVEYRWFDKDNLGEIYNQMMPADRYLFPFLINNLKFKGEVHFSDEFRVTYCEIKEVSNWQT